MKIVTQMLEEELYRATTETGKEVTIDMRPGDVKQGQSPPELLLSSLAACGAVDIVVMLRKRKKTIISFVIETDGTRQAEHPRYFTDIHCKFIVTSPDVTEDELYKTAKLSLEKYCTVASSLKSNITFSALVIRP